MAKKKEKYRVVVDVTKVSIPIDVMASNQQEAKRIAKRMAEKDDYGGIAPPRQTPKVMVKSVERIYDDIDYEEGRYS